MTDQERREKLNALAAQAYKPATEFGANDNITFDAYVVEDVDGTDKLVKKPVSTLNNNKLEDHFFFKDMVKDIQ